MNKGNILALNASVELTQMLTEVLQDEGYNASYAYILELKNSTLTVSEVLKTHQPELIIYDIALPYEENWKFFNTLQKITIIKDIKVILTTTDKVVLDALVGPTKTLEIVGKPFDLNILLRKVKRQLKEAKSPTPTL